MTDPDQTPILNRIDRALHAVHKRSPAEALAAYRQAALTSPTVTGTAAAHDCRTSECKGVRLGDGSTHWTCKGCGSTWSTARPEDKGDTGYWSVFVVVLALVGSLVVLAVGFGLGYVARGWAA